MPVDLSKSLVIGISSSALFDMREADEIYRQQGLDKYSEYQIQQADAPLNPGTGFPLVRAVLNLNEITRSNPKATRKADLLSRAIHSDAANSHGDRHGKTTAER